MEEKPKRKPGRPQGSYTLDEPKSENLTVTVTPTAKKWLDGKPRGWLVDWIESEARGL